MVAVVSTHRGVPIVTIRKSIYFPLIVIIDSAQPSLCRIVVLNSGHNNNNNMQGIKTMALKPWNIRHIQGELKKSFNQCQTDTERSVWRVYAGRDCRRVIGDRKPTPGEISILDTFGLYV